MQSISHEEARLGFRTALWVALLASASLVFSSAFACATPFAALATVAGTQLRWPQAMAAVGLAWLGNQAIGYGLLGYPQTWDSLAWGGAIGLAALAAVAVAAVAARLGGRGISVVVAAFFAAFCAYEITLLAATVVLPSEPLAFASSTVARIFAIDAAACAVLFALQAAARAFGLPLASGRIAEAG